LSAPLFTSGGDAYGKAADDLLLQLRARCRDLRVKSELPQEVGAWISKVHQSIPGWDFEPVASALGDAASFAGFEDWGEFDDDRLERVVSRATTHAASQEAAFANADIAQVVVLGVLSWARPRTDGLDGSSVPARGVRA
jgi:hypothetical protein